MFATNTLFCSVQTFESIALYSGLQRDFLLIFLYRNFGLLYSTEIQVYCFAQVFPTYIFPQSLWFTVRHKNFILLFSTDILFYCFIQSPLNYYSTQRFQFTAPHFGVLYPTEISVYCLLQTFRFTVFYRDFSIMVPSDYYSPQTFQPTVFTEILVYCFNQRFRFSVSQRIFDLLFPQRLRLKRKQFAVFHKTY